MLKWAQPGKYPPPSPKPTQICSSGAGEAVERVRSVLPALRRPVGRAVLPGLLPDQRAARGGGHRRPHVPRGDAREHGGDQQRRAHPHQPPAVPGQLFGCFCACGRRPDLAFLKHYMQKRPPPPFSKLCHVWYRSQAEGVTE